MTKSLQYQNKCELWNLCLTVLSVSFVWFLANELCSKYECIDKEREPATITVKKFTKRTIALNHYWKCKQHTRQQKMHKSEHFCWHFHTILSHVFYQHNICIWLFTVNSHRECWNIVATLAQTSIEKKNERKLEKMSLIWVYHKKTT